MVLFYNMSDTFRVCFFQKTNLHYRGARVFLAVIEDLMAKGMKNAENV